MELGNVLAEAEIRGLLIRERFYRDTSQWTKLRSCYHPDSSLTLIDISWYQGDVDGFIRGSENMAAKGALAIHTVQPVDISIRGSKAFAESLGTISTRFHKNGADYDLVSHCRLLSRLQQTPILSDSSCAWKMLSMEIIYVQDCISPVVPTDICRDPGFLDAIAGKRKSYQLLSWIMEERGYTINDGLPGVDHPSGVGELLSRNHKWLLS